MTAVSVVIPVYRSEAIVARTIERTLAALERLDVRAQIVLVNDASPDGSWNVLAEHAHRDERVVAVDLAQNVGQHRALMIGLQLAGGDWVVTLDDDLQNPPEEIEHLMRAAEGGADLVFGRFRRKQHSAPRVAASRLVTRLNRIVYGLPRGLVVSNVRLMSRELVARVLDLRAQRVYLTGFAIRCAERVANAEIEHEPRAEGGSSYSARKLVALLSNVVLAHPAIPWGGLALLALALSVALATGTATGALTPAWGIPLAAIGLALAALAWRETREPLAWRSYVREILGAD